MVLALLLNFSLALEDTVRKLDARRLAPFTRGLRYGSIVLA